MSGGGYERVLYLEPGSTWWPLLWGPAFAAVGAGLEAFTGPVHTVPWLIVAIALFGLAALWVNARRKVYRVELTPSQLTQGRETIDTGTITQVTDVGAAAGARVLGGGWTAPRKTTEVPIRLEDGTVVLAWALDGEAFQEALADLVEKQA
ncbi:hypothetical protein [Actinophytocola sp.]|uniref:hypothetical protein n=1 Tax=Actinophytocola sp. TaxID=1872138 RepID=UPI00389A9EE8